jgi:hypothetical protein
MVEYKMENIKQAVLVSQNAEHFTFYCDLRGYHL